MSVRNLGGMCMAVAGLGLLLGVWAAGETEGVALAAWFAGLLLVLGSHRFVGTRRS
jgi:hypothetical protein